MSNKNYRYLIVSLLVLSVSLLFFFFKLKSNQTNTQQANSNTFQYDAIMLSALNKYGVAARSRLKPLFKRSGVRYPPKELTLIGIKEDQILEVWARNDRGWHWIISYPLTAMSGVLGPKLRQGDRQIPEGIYKVNAFNAESRYHLSMRLNYPNTFDSLHAKLEKRLKPGKNIFIHGKDASVGCIAIGDKAIEELFILVAATGKHNVTVIVAPYDFRVHVRKTKNLGPKWLPILYAKIRQALQPFSINDSR